MRLTRHFKAVFGVSFSRLFLKILAIILDMISKQAIKEFKQIIKKDYGKDLSEDQVEELGTSLLRLTRVGLSALARQSEKEKRKANWS